MKHGSSLHNLEHGTVIISYKSERIKCHDLQQIRAQAREFSLTNARLILTLDHNWMQPLYSLFGVILKSLSATNP